VHPCVSPTTFAKQLKTHGLLRKPKHCDWRIVRTGLVPIVRQCSSVTLASSRGPLSQLRIIFSPSSFSLFQSTHIVKSLHLDAADIPYIQLAGTRDAGIAKLRIPHRAASTRSQECALEDDAGEPSVTTFAIVCTIHLDGSYTAFRASPWPDLEGEDWCLCKADR
jgi:hypothetical protein